MIFEIKISVMNQSPNIDLLEIKNTTLLDLPNEILVEIFKLIDIPSRFKMRLNGRLDQIQLTVPNEIEQIDIDVSPFMKFHNCIAIQFFDFFIFICSVSIFR